MFVTRGVLMALGLVLTSSVAHAEAITYAGVIGTQAVLIEITEPADGPFFGRLTRLVDGVDVPLHALSVSDGALELVEELSCLAVDCVEGDAPPLGARLVLRLSGEDYVGSWSDGTREEAVRLALAGSRSYDRHESFDYQSFLWRSYGEPLSPDNSPYDYLRMQVQIEEGPAVDMGLNLAIRMMTDPRTKFAFPRVVSTNGGPDTTRINAVLEAMHWETNMRGFACLAMGFLSGGWSENVGEDIGTLGHVDEEQVSVSFLSPALISFVQSGSLYCAGSAFYNHIDYSTLDLATGEPFDLSHVFRGWGTGPDAELVAFLRARISPDMAGCETWEEIPDFLDISFEEGDVAVFRIAGLDSLPCEGPFFSAPLKELRPLLAPGVAEIFPDLAQ